MGRAARFGALVVAGESLPCFALRGKSVGETAAVLAGTRPAAGGAAGGFLSSSFLFVFFFSFYLFFAPN